MHGGFFLSFFFFFGLTEMLRVQIPDDGSEREKAWKEKHRPKRRHNHLIKDARCKKRISKG